jgi:hypothetical protein
VHQIVQRLASQRSLLAQPRRVAGELLEQLRHSFRCRPRAELRQLPPRHIHDGSSGCTRRLVKKSALLLEAARRSHRQAHVAGRIDEQGQGARGLGRRRICIDPDPAQIRPGRGERRLRRRPPFARRELRISRRRTHHARKVGALQAIDRNAEVSLRRRRDRFPRDGVRRR